MRFTLYDEPVSVFGRQLRAWRERAGLSQERLGQRLGHAKPSTVQSWEKGRRTPRPVSVRAIATALALTPDERRLALDLLMGVASNETPPSPPAAARPAAPDPLTSGLAEALPLMDQTDRDYLTSIVDAIRKKLRLKPIGSTPSRARAAQR